MTGGIVVVSKATTTTMSTPTMLPAHFNTNANCKSPSSTTSTPTTNSAPTIEWSHDRIMQLIHLYEKKSVLWNPSNPEYFHRDIRNMVYDDLVRELNIDLLTVNETKRKLENLRSYFRRETKKLQDHERKTGEKLVSRWPYYESLHFIQEFMSVKNETGETGFAKNMARPTSYPSALNLSMKTEQNNVDVECAVQVPVNYSNSSFLQNDDLVAVLKALQAPLSESAASCLVNSIQSESDKVISPNTPISPRSPNTQQHQRIEAIQNGVHPDSKPGTPLLPQNLALPSPPGAGIFSAINGDIQCPKRRRLDKSVSEDLCSDYGRTVAHQLRQMDTYSRDMCRLQIDQLIFNIVHSEKCGQNSS